MKEPVASAEPNNQSKIHFSFTNNCSVATPPVLPKGAYAHVLSVCVCVCACRMSTTSRMFDTCRHLPKILLTPAGTCQ